MAFDGIVTRAMVTELRQELIMGKINKIHQPVRDELVFDIYTNNGTKRLFASAGSSAPRIHLIEKNLGNPPSPSPFCMLLRKHLSGGRIVSIEQVGCDRIIEITLETITELGFTASRKLVFEIMGKHSNIILLDCGADAICAVGEGIDRSTAGEGNDRSAAGEGNDRSAAGEGNDRSAAGSDNGSGIVIDAIKHVSFDTSRARQILPGIKYVYPPAQDKIGFDKITSEELQSLPADEKAILSKVAGISRQFAEELANTMNESDADAWGLNTMNADARNANASDADASDAYAKLKEAISEAEGHFTPRIYYEQKDSSLTPVDFYICDLSIYEETCEKRTFPSLSETINLYYEGRENTNSIKQRSHDLIKTVDSLLEKARLKSQRLSEDLLEAENSDKYRIYGELLNANIHRVSPGATTVVLDNYYDGNKIDIPLNPKYSAAKNAQNYFKKYGKAKTAIKEKALQIEETKSDILYLESVQTFLENLDRPEDIEQIRQELVENGYVRRKKTNQKNKRFKSEPHRYTSPSGFEILVGRNNKENDELTFKLADKTDIWLHTKDIPGSHVILRTKGNEPTEADIHFAAAIAAWHSKAKSSGQVPVDYARVRYVKKPAGAKPGMVIFTNNRTVYVTPQIP